MLIRGIIRGLETDRMRVLLERTSLDIDYPTIPKREIIKEVVERKSAGVKSKESQRKSSNIPIITKTLTSKKIVSNSKITTETTPTSTTPTVITRTITTYSKTKPYAI